VLPCRAGETVARFACRRAGSWSALPSMVGTRSFAPSKASASVTGTSHRISCSWRTNRHAAHPVAIVQIPRQPLYLPGSPFPSHRTFEPCHPRGNFDLQAFHAPSRRGTLHGRSGAAHGLSKLMSTLCSRSGLRPGHAASRCRPAPKLFQRSSPVPQKRRAHQEIFQVAVYPPAKPPPPAKRGVEPGGEGLVAKRSLFFATFWVTQDRVPLRNSLKLLFAAASPGFTSG